MLVFLYMCVPFINFLQFFHLDLLSFFLFCGFFVGYFCGFSICLQRLFDTIIPLQYAEKMRQNIEPCDIDGDIQLYIKYHKTGSEKPRKYRKSPVKGKSIVKYSISRITFMY